MARARLASRAIAKNTPAQTARLERSRGKHQPIRIGFVGLTDCAPLIMARELGLFERHGLDVELSRELGWATVRAKIIHDELDAAHAPAGLLLATAAGLGGVSAECLTGVEALEANEVGEEGLGVRIPDGLRNNEPAT